MDWCIDRMRPVFPELEPEKYARGVRYIWVVDSDLGNVRFVLITELDSDKRPHGRRISMPIIERDGDYYARNRWRFVHGIHNNAFRWSVKSIYENVTEKYYYVDGEACPKNVLEVKQRKAIMDLLPQPIAEEVLENYSID